MIGTDVLSSFYRYLIHGQSSAALTSGVDSPYLRHARGTILRTTSGINGPPAQGPLMPPYHQRKIKEVIHHTTSWLARQPVLASMTWGPSPIDRVGNLSNLRVSSPVGLTILSVIKYPYLIAQWIYPILLSADDRLLAENAPVYIIGAACQLLLPQREPCQLFSFNFDGFKI